ncbi:transposable element Tcb1 transposase [Trichonephila clavipes]|nr:transposable element Tcb1 transposase [Trichonephila clavipes]
MEAGWSARTPSTDQSSIRPPHRKKCTSTANYFISRHPGTVAPSLGAPVSSRTIRRHLAEGQLHTASTAGVMVWGVNAYNTRSPLVFIRGTITAQRKIGSRVRRNKTTVMRICDRWMLEGTTDRRGRSHPPQCTTSREDRQIVRMAVTGRSVTSRTVAQHIESVTHHSVSARTIRRRLQQSGLSTIRPLLGLPLTQNHRRLRCQWCDKRRMWVAEKNEVVFTDESRICLQHHNGRIRVWRHRGERMLNSCVMHRHTGPAPGIMVWGGIGYHSRTPLARIAGGTLNSQRYISEVLEPPHFLTFRTWPRPYFNRIMRDHTWPALSKGSSSITRLNCFLGRLALRIFRR